MIEQDDISEFVRPPEFIRQGIEYARPDVERGAGHEERNRREACILAFAAVWEALHQPGLITTRLEIELIGRWAETEIQTAYLRRLAEFDQ